jgi:hypothetical protein
MKKLWQKIDVVTDCAELSDVVTDYAELKKSDLLQKKQVAKK